MVKVSVIVPVYNVERYVARCLDSLLAQTLEDVEIVVVNDGSTDKSGDICQDYAKRYSNIKYIIQKNQGLSGARNTGITHATGKYIGFVDSDDFVEEDMFELLYDNAEKEKVMISCCGYMDYYDSGKAKVKTVSGIKKLYDRQSALDEVLLDRYFSVISCNKIYRRELFNKIEFPVGKIYEDILTVYKLIDAAGGLYFDSVPKYLYYKRADSISNAQFNPETLKIIDYVDELVECCEKEIKDPRYLYVGQIMWYMLVYNKIICSGKDDKSLRDKIRKMIKNQWKLILFGSKIGKVGFAKTLLLWFCPSMYRVLYTRLINHRDIKHGDLTKHSKEQNYDT